MKKLLCLTTVFLSISVYANESVIKEAVDRFWAEEWNLSNIKKNQCKIAKTLAKKSNDPVHECAYMNTDKPVKVTKNQFFSGDGKSTMGRWISVCGSADGEDLFGHFVTVDFIYVYDKFLHDTKPYYLSNRITKSLNNEPIKQKAKRISSFEQAKARYCRL